MAAAMVVVVWWWVGVGEGGGGIAAGPMEDLFVCFSTVALQERGCHDGGEQEGEGSRLQ